MSQNDSNLQQVTEQASGVEWIKNDSISFWNVVGYSKVEILR